MKNLTTLIILCMGLLCHASPKPKDTIYTNVETLMKKIGTTKKKTATYYLVLKDGDDKEVKVRIDLKQIDAEIPLFNSSELDIKKLLALKEESLVKPKEKLVVFDAKAKEWVRLKKEVITLTKEHDALKADTLSLDSIAIAKVEQDLQDKKLKLEKAKTAATNLFNEYEKMIDSLLGNLHTQYKKRLVAAMEEAYEKIENKETTFKSVDDDATWFDIRIDLLKLDATRELNIPRRINGKKDDITEKITAGNTYYILHFSEFGAWYEKDQVIKVFNAIKLSEFHLNPYLVDKQFGMVCDDQDRTQYYINSVVDYKDYSGNLDEEDDSKFENIFLEDVQWISQIDEMYRGTSCWKWTCCNRAANEILSRSGTGTDRSRQVVIAQSIQQNCGNISMVSKEKFDEGINIIKSSLTEHKLPILVGVHHPVKDEYGIYIKEVCSGNIPSTTNHYIVVVGMGYDKQRQKNYFRFYEVGTGQNSHGTSIENKLYVNDDLMIITGKTSYKLDNINHYYTLTEIRKNNGKTY